MRKFLQQEIDLIYEKLRPDEEILWRGKPNAIPNLAFLSTLILLLAADLFFIFLHYLTIENRTLMTLFDDWFSLVLIFSLFVLIIYIFIYVRRSYYQMIKTFYVVTSTRLVIFDSRKGRIVFSKLYAAVKLLRHKKTIFDSESIIFDIDIVNERIVEIGFNNINNASEVLNIINRQLSHFRRE